jgi:16S rRNA (cytidine1402-2'-O)-methyltransferase
MTGTLYIVATPIGNPDDLSPRAIRILGSVSVIAAEDPAGTQVLLAPHKVATPLTSYQNDNKEEKTPILLQQLEEGRDVALVVDAGTPVISDPGCFLIDAAAGQGIRIAPVPGPSAAVAALSISGFSGDVFSVLGQVPAGLSAHQKLFRRWKHAAHALALFAHPQQLRQLLNGLRTALGNRRAVVAANLTTPQEQVVRGALAELARNPALKNLEGDVTVVIEGARKSRRRARPRRASGRRAS